MRTERFVPIKSPVTGGRVKEVFDVEEKEFRKEKYRVHVRYYMCVDTGEQFTTAEQDELFCNDLYSQYRNTHNMPFPDEIKSIRERYGLNYAQLSKIMGFGINQWKSYEEGNVPSESNAKLILTVRRKDGMMRLLKESRPSFEDREYARIVSRIESACDDADSKAEDFLFYGNTKRGLLNGFSPLDCRKLKAMVCYIISKAGSGICPTKLNKEMFYADFRHFVKSGHSISGLNYRAIQYGPVPEHFDTIYDNIEGIEKIRTISYDKESVSLVPGNMDSIDYGDVLGEDELSTLDEVTSEFAGMKTMEVVAKSHEEIAWIENNDSHEIIPYSYAYLLK